MKHLIVLLVLCISSFCLGQERNNIIQQRIEFISEQLETESIDLTNLLEQFNYYFDNPIDLNKATRDELIDLSLLTDIQISDLIVHRKLHGKLISIYESNLPSLNASLRLRCNPSRFSSNETNGRTK